jgi:hypothetical protein
MNTAAKDPPRNFFLRFWQGKARLWQAFWLVGVLGKLLVVTSVTVGSFMIWRGPQDDALLYGLCMPVLVSYLFLHQ